MKKIVLIPISIIILGFIFVSYSDYVTFKTKKDLYSESARIQERIAKYEKLLNEANKLRAKVEILKRRRIDDNELKDMIKKCESFLAETEEVKTKKLKLIYEYNKISKRYNRLSDQKLFFKKNLPEIINAETQPAAVTDR